ncbi:MAG: ferrichrome ABC transporter substrate-binding protein [Desulfobulbus propionicus]|nr:MAG: ferrichrome ABC transporter substrate-binding protein [Desulfobulbus propionicus]
MSSDPITATPGSGICKGDIMYWLRIFFLLVFTSSVCTAAETKEVTVVDQAGRTVVIKQPVQRVVTTFIPATFFALSAGLSDRLVGASSKDVTTSIYEALIDPEAPPKLVGNRSVGLNLETITSLKPDLVIMHGQKDGVRLADRLTKLGFPAIVIVPESLKDMEKALDLIGLATDNQAHTDAVVKEMSRIVKNVTARVASKERPRVYYATSRLLRTISGEMMQHHMIAIAGGKNVSAELQGFFSDISKEQLLVWNPDIVLCSDRLRKKEIEQLASPELSGITASKEHRIYRVPAQTYWDFPSPLAMAGIIWMSSKIHPDVYKDGVAQQEIEQFYDTLFGPGFSAEHPTVVGKPPQ